ncbi:MAG: toxin-antitoxin system antitoxin subunit [Betaproteobacteria bacterium]
MTEPNQASLAAAIKHCVAAQEWQIAAINLGTAAADRGEFTDHLTLKTKWEKRLAVQMDKTR